MRCSVAFLVVAALCTGTVHANEHIIISGGPALRYNEKTKVNTHDRYWGNFIRSATLNFQEFLPDVPEEDTVTWLVYRPAYVSRSKEEKEDLTQLIKTQAKELGVNLVWFNNRKELIQYLNSNRSRDNKIARLEYFGHSNKRDWMFDYSNKLDGASWEPGMLHIWNFEELDRDAFAKKAFVKSWGCHSGEAYSGEWKKRTGTRMIGAIGKTDYSNGGIPFLSTEGGRWAN